MVPKNIRIVKKASEKAKVLSEAVFVSEKRRKINPFCVLRKNKHGSQTGRNEVQLPKAQ